MHDQHDCLAYNVFIWSEILLRLVAVSCQKLMLISHLASQYSAMINCDLIQTVTVMMEHKREYCYSQELLLFREKISTQCIASYSRGKPYVNFLERNKKSFSERPRKWNKIWKYKKIFEPKSKQTVQSVILTREKFNKNFAYSHTCDTKCQTLQPEQLLCVWSHDGFSTWHSFL